MILAEKSFRQYEVKDAPGYGSFKIRIKEGNRHPLTYKVPVYKLPPYGEGNEDDYIKKSFIREDALPIVALRSGSEGMCIFAINKKQVIVDKVIHHYLADKIGELGSLEWNQNVAREENSKFYVNCFEIENTKKSKDGFLGNYHTIKGHTISGEDFTAWVYYQPSKTN